MSNACDTFGACDTLGSAHKTSVLLFLSPIVEFTFTLSLLYLFVRPFYDLSRLSGARGQSRELTQIRSMLNWNMAMSAVNLISSNVILTGHAYSAFFVYLVPPD